MQELLLLCTHPRISLMLFRSSAHMLFGCWNYIHAQQQFSNLCQVSCCLCQTYFKDMSLEFEEEKGGKGGQLSCYYVTLLFAPQVYLRTYSFIEHNKTKKSLTLPNATFL